MGTALDSINDPEIKSNSIYDLGLKSSLVMAADFGTLPPHNQSIFHHHFVPTPPHLLKDSTMPWN